MFEWDGQSKSFYWTLLFWLEIFSNSIYFPTLGLQPAVVQSHLWLKCNSTKGKSANSSHNTIRLLQHDLYYSKKKKGIFKIIYIHIFSSYCRRDVDGYNIIMLLVFWRPFNFLSVRLFRITTLPKWLLVADVVARLGNRFL